MCVLVDLSQIGQCSWKKRPCALALDSQDSLRACLNEIPSVNLVSSSICNKRRRSKPANGSESVIRVLEHVPEGNAVIAPDNVELRST